VRSIPSPESSFTGLLRCTPPISASARPTDIAERPPSAGTTTSDCHSRRMSENHSCCSSDEGSPPRERGSESELDLAGLDAI
jgi:hypothetical protein